MNLYESVTLKLKEAEELNSRVDDLVNSLKSEGYSVNTNDNRHFNVSSGSSELNMVIYEGGNNEADFEDDTVGLGGDTGGNTVYPLVTQGWDYDDAAPYKVKKQTGESVYAIFNSLNQVSSDDIVRVINAAFNAHDKSKDKEEEIEVLDSEEIKEEDNFREEFGSESNTEAYDKLKELIKYFNQYIEIVKKESFYYQNEDLDKLYKVLTKLYEVQDALDEAWKLDEGESKNIDELNTIDEIEKEIERIEKEIEYCNKRDEVSCSFGTKGQIEELEDKLAKLKEKLNSVEE